MQLIKNHFTHRCVIFIKKNKKIKLLGLINNIL